MKYITDSDRRYIENKYHRQDQPFDPYKRYAYHGYEFDQSTGLNDEEMLCGLERLYETTKSIPRCLAKAKAFSYVLDNMRIDVNEHDYFVGLYNWGRLLGETFMGKWYKEIDESMPETMELINDLSESGTASVWLDTEHFVPNWEMIMELGIPGILDNVRKHRSYHNEEDLTEQQKAYFDSMELEYEAILRLIGRLHDYAKKQNHKKAVLIAQTMENLKNGAPKTFLDAIELMYIFFMCSEYVEQYQARSLGNGLDHTLIEFYESDIARGKFTHDEIKSFIAYFLLQFDSIGHPQGHPFYLSGMGADGKDRTSQLTYDILDVYESLNIFNPKLQIKLHPDTPDVLIDKVVRMIRSGKNSVVFCCQPGIIKSLMTCYGASFEEACECDISGCNEQHIKANEACMISALPNAAKAVNYVFSNGIDSVTGKKLGLETGDVTSFSSFDEFYNAFLKQMANIVDVCIDIANSREKYVGDINPSVLLSAITPNSLETMKDAYSSGVKYPTSALLLCSFASAVDSLLAVKELVYDDKQVSMRELKKALENNWDGYEHLRKKAVNIKHRYGNGDSEADKFAAEFFKWFAAYVNGRPNSRGGVFKTGVPSTMEFAMQGKVTEATPDGRRMGEELSRNIAPVAGAERKGITGTLRSAMQLETHLFCEACVVDMMLHPSAVQGEEGLEAMKALIKTFMKNDGMSIQFNIFDAATLRDARKNPEKYGDLQVRITGWNALWNKMSEEEQEAYIIRAESLAQ
ncbi:MAG: hypothetical protein IJC09_02840 [Clostridia bacterium]|nr:hypothetical protein [Clostridia bacterium]